ncbi:MAG: IgGFc-binding protein, partial [Candidatus Kapaibacteriota bacterium]
MLSCVIVASAQNGAIPTNAISGYAGRYFLIGFMQNEIMILPGGIRLSITISTIRPTTIRIASPISRPSQFYQIPGDTVIELTFPYGDVEMFDSERAMLKAIEIESDQPITVSGMSSQSLSTDGFSAIPVSKWGREYVIHSWPNDIYIHDDDPQGKIPRSSQFMVIAAEDNTVIEFTPRSRTFQKIQSGESTIIQLNKGQCYLVKSDTLPAGSGDLSGTIVRSDKPIGVFSGHVRTAIPLGLLEF